MVALPLMPQLYEVIPKLEIDRKVLDVELEQLVAGPSIKQLGPGRLPPSVLQVREQPFALVTVTCTWKAPAKPEVTEMELPVLDPTRVAGPLTTHK